MVCVEIFGDRVHYKGRLNMVTSLQDKKGGRRILTSKDIKFKDLISSSHLVDLETLDGTFT